MLREPDATLEPPRGPAPHLASAESSTGLDPARASQLDDRAVPGSLRARPAARHMSLVTALAVTVIVAVSLLAIFADRVAPYDPLEGNYGVVRQAPSAQHWFGTDD